VERLPGHARTHPQDVGSTAIETDAWHVALQ
jgi:hypothetical protein